MIYFSKSTCGFYNDSINEFIPDDAVEITDEYHQELLEEQAKGKTIEADASGYPVLRDPPAPTIEQLRELAIAQRRAAYQLRADPLFFRWQRGEDGYTKELWEAEIELIKQEIPYPED
jgi:hypothetical protein